jgi:hypothetical protein
MAGLGFGVVFEALFPAKPSACQGSPTGRCGANGDGSQIDASFLTEFRYYMTANIQ